MHVYFIEGAGLIKIGHGAQAHDRFYAMLTHCPVPLSLLAAMTGDAGVETELHRRFADQRSHGEWFNRSPELDAVIAAAPIKYGPEFQNCRASLNRKAGSVKTPNKIVKYRNSISGSIRGLNGPRWWEKPTP